MAFAYHFACVSSTELAKEKKPAGASNIQTKDLTTAIVLFSVLALKFGSGLLAADVLVGANVASATQTPLDQIDHSVWDGLLKKYVDDNGMVNYEAWKANSGDTLALEQYLAQLSQSNGKGTKELQLAFWINGLQRCDRITGAFDTSMGYASPSGLKSCAQ